MTRPFQLLGIEAFDGIMTDEPTDQELKKVIADLISRGLIAKVNDKYILTEKGWEAATQLDKENIERVLKTNNWWEPHQILNPKSKENPK